MHIYRSLHFQYHSINQYALIDSIKLYLDMLTFCCIRKQNHDQGFQFVFRWVHRLTSSLFTVTDIRYFESNSFPVNRQIMINASNQKGQAEWISNIST